MEEGKSLNLGLQCDARDARKYYIDARNGFRSILT